MLAAILLFLLAVAIVATARLLSTQLAWRRLQRRLADGSPADQVTGAWAWTRMRLDACRLPLGLDVSPDGLAVGGTGDDLPGDVYAALRELAAVTTTAAFAHEQRIGRGGAAAAWRVAARAEASAREHLTRRGRARLAFRRPRTQVHS